VLIAVRFEAVWW